MSARDGDASLGDRVIEYVADFCGFKVGELPLHADIDRVLGVTGDDAEELVLGFASRFGVSLDQFDFSLHFGPEAGFSCNPMLGQLPVSTEHLIRVAKAGHWLLALSEGGAVDAHS